MKLIIKLSSLLMLFLLQSVNLFAQPISLPRLEIDDLEYQGAFAIPPTQPLDMSANSSTGTIVYNRANKSLFIAGHQRYGKIAEFSIPDLVNTKTDVSALNQATLLQNFRAVLNAAPTGNPQQIDVINGMALVNGKLIVNTETKYDGAADNTHTTLVIENASNLANSAVRGYYSLQGATHAAGWMSPVPAEWQATLGGSYITGHANKYSINRRYSIGASAFAFNPADISGTSGTIPTTALLDFSIDNPLHADYNNYDRGFYNMLEVNGDASFTGHTFEDADGVVGTNDLWTVLTQASYGFIVPGTRTYLTVGASGGHNSGIGYKPKQSHGYTCPGPCPYDGEDYYNYYWLWDVNDLLDVKNGVKESYEVRPYDYGLFEELFRSDENPRPWDLQTITGGTFDADNGILYLSIHDGASTNRYEKLPAIVAYKINVDNTCTDADNDGVCADIDPDDNDPCVPNSCGECELLTNSTFDNEKAPWINWECQVASVNGLAAVTNIQPSNQNWKVVMMQPGVPVEQGENYTVKFSAKADANRPLSVVLQLDGSPYTRYFYETVNLTPDMEDYTLNFIMNDPTDDDTNFMFLIGNSTVNTYIDNVSFTKADCSGSSCTQQGQSCNDQDPCTIGETYDADCNCTGGIYTDADQDGVCVGNDPDDNDPCVPNSCGGGECEILTNTTFDNNTDPWINWGADVRAVNGTAAITNIQSSNQPWGVGFVQKNIPVEQGEDYTVKFSAKADANRPLTVLVELQGAPYTRYFQTVVNLSPNMRDYTFDFTMDKPTDNNANFIFYMGGNRTNTYIDNASLTKADCDTPPPSGQCDCPAVAQPGNVVTVRNVTELRNAISQANNQNGNMTIKVEPGVYQLNSGFYIRPNTPNLTIMGTTGNRDDVFIKGQGYNGGVTAIFLVAADNFSVADLTVGEVSTHAIQIQAQDDADDFTAVNVRFVDINEQMLKVSGGDGSNFSDRGRVLCCAFEFTADIGYQFYTGGIDCHRSKDWVISNNTFDGIRSPEALLAEHAIHMWRVCEGTIVTNNQITNCDRGIGFGLGDAFGNGHTGGLIMNNFVHTNRDVGIGLEYSPGTKVYNNTVITDNYSRSIEYRFSATSDVRIINNLTSGSVAQRSGAPTATTSGNYRASDLSIFADAANHDYHLTGRPAGIVDAGTPLSEVTTDIDCENRTSRIDIGADEVTSGVKEDLSSDSSFTLYPNPANQTIQLIAEISENTQTQIQVYDAFGKLVKHITNIELISGSPINVDVAQLPAGMYFCTLQSGEWQAVQKFVIAR